MPPPSKPRKYANLRRGCFWRHSLSLCLTVFEAGRLASRDPPGHGAMHISPFDFAIIYRLSRGHHGVRRPFSPRPAHPSRLFPRRPHRALVGAGLLDRRHRNLHSHDYRHAGNRFCRKPWFLATGAGLPGRAGGSVRGAHPAVFPGRILHGLPASGKAIWQANEVGGGRSFFWARGRWPRACAFRRSAKW